MTGYKHMLEIDGKIRTPYAGVYLETGKKYESDKGYHFYLDKEFALGFAATIPQMRVFECEVPYAEETYDNRDFKANEIILIRQL